MRTLALMITLVATCVLTAASHAPEVDEALQTSTVFLVRHAEKVTDGASQDPPLTEAGERRAQALARLLSHAGVTHVYTTQFQRTRTTIEPLAAAAGLTAKVIGAQQPAEQIESLCALPAGSVAVVAGHSNTVPRLVEALGGSVAELVEVPPYGGILADHSYDRLFMITFGEGVKTQVVELRYGDPS